MRIAQNLVPQILKGVHLNICQQLFLRKLVVFAMSKTRSPGRFPEGKVGDSGRVPGRTFSYVTFSGLEEFPCGSSGVLCGEGVSQVVIAPLPGRNPEGNPEGKSEKVGLGSQRDRNEDGPGRRCSWSRFWETVCKLDKFIKTLNPGRFPEGKVGDSGRVPGRGIFMDNAMKE